jgi:hypothetical protein
MREVTVSTIISAPREEVFDFVCDLASRPAYTDHFMDDSRVCSQSGLAPPLASSSTPHCRTSTPS